MERSFEATVRERLADYLADENSIDEFKAWLVAATWSPQQSQASQGIQFANEIKLAFAGHSGGYRSDEELRSGLAELLNRSLVKAG